MLLLVPYHGLRFLPSRGDTITGFDFSVFWLHLWRMGFFFAVSAAICFRSSPTRAWSATPRSAGSSTARDGARRRWVPGDRAAPVAAREAILGPVISREVLLLTTGGTIVMTGPPDGGTGVTPGVGAKDLLAMIPPDRRPPVRVEEAMNRPSAHLTLSDQLAIARRARDGARLGLGVVVTHGTDTLEETAMLTDILHDSAPPVVFTGAIRPASLPGADGPANLADALAVASGPDAAGRGALVCFGGEIHQARTVRKADATSPLAFASPQTGPIGRVTEGQARFWRRTGRNPQLDPDHLDFRVPVVPAVSGDDGDFARMVLDSGPDGIVVGTLGGGHLSPAALRVWAGAAETMPVVATSRPDRGAILRDTYGYEASERDLRRTSVIPAGFLSAQAARIKLLACLGSGLDQDGIGQAFAADDS